jgi:hypothetical protein
MFYVPIWEPGPVGLARLDYQRPSDKRRASRHDAREMEARRAEESAMFIQGGLEDLITEEEYVLLQELLFAEGGAPAVSTAKQKVAPAGDFTDFFLEDAASFPALLTRPEVAMGGGELDFVRHLAGDHDDDAAARRSPDSRGISPENLSSSPNTLSSTSSTTTTTSEPWIQQQQQWCAPKPAVFPLPSALCPLLFSPHH